ncbi:tyrosine-type recombinase/integrase [Kaistia nematophila]|uniref:Tyrosine-type recombinase/integrase n=1 Tax=Kaistia nematophila TaxID=2994654 RepID=A0A9X3E1G1_9HYPH|nr:tyrosine-type recombinase/integrase [Kaistia nematophila]
MPKQARPKQASDRVGRLLEWWGEKRLSEVTQQSCDQYAAHRREAERKRRADARKAALAAGRKSKAKEPRGNTTGGSRRDLEDLRSAINHHAKRNLHSGVIEVALPAKGSPRPTWLTRSEVARLIWVCWRHGRAVKLPKGSRKGETVESKFHDLRHIARFILMGVYTGSRSGAIFSSSIYAGSNRSFVDLDSGIFYRLADGAAETNKRQPPAPIPDRLLTHLRRWKRLGVISQYVVEWDGLPVKSIKVGWASALALAGIDKGATPHTLRHTAATWLMQNGVDTWEAAGYLGMSEEVLRRVYGHHHPAFMRNAASAITGKRKAR